MGAEIALWMDALFGAIPGRIGRALRSLYFRARLGACGSRLSIGRHVEVGCPGNMRFGSEIYVVDGAILRACEGTLTIGDRFALNGGARIVADGGTIAIGCGVMIGPNVVVRASNHRTNRTDIPIWEQGQTGGTISIGDDVWIGASAVIVANVVIGSHAVVAAGSVVTRNVPDFAVVAGVPARVLRDRRTPISEETAIAPAGA